MWGLGPGCPGGHSAQSRIRVIFSALPFPSLAKLRREHQVQRQGHQCDSVSDPINPCRAGLEGQEHRDVPTGKVTRCDRLLCSLPVLGLLLLLTRTSSQTCCYLSSIPRSVLHNYGFPNFGPHKLSITNLGGFNSHKKPPEKAKAILQSAPYTSPANCQQSEHTSVSPSSLLSLPGSNAHENHFKKK